MEKTDLRLTYCRYFKGEKENPFGFNETPKRYFWDWEKQWYEEQKVLEQHGESAFLSSVLSEYLATGIEPDSTDPTPVAIQAILYNRFTNVLNGNKEGFLRWYDAEYMR